jgi:MFS family permease
MLMDTIECDNGRSDGSVSRWGLLRNPEFLAIWFVGTATSTVRWLEVLALGIFVFDLTGSPFQVALMLILRMLPLVFVGPLTGVLAERANRRSVMISCLLVMSLICLGFAVLSWNVHLSVFYLGLSAVLNGLFWTLENPVRRPLIGEIVGTPQLGAAMSLDAVTFSGTRLLGPLLGGVFLEFYGLGGVFITGGVLYFLAALVSLKIRAHSHIYIEKSTSLKVLLGNTLHLLRSHRLLTGILAVTIIFNLWGIPFLSMIPVIGKEVLGLSPLPVGLLVSVEGAGALLGALYIVANGKLQHYRRLYTYGVLLYLVMVLGFSQMQWVFPSAVCLLLVGLGGGFFGAMQSALILMCVPPEMRSRMMGVLSLCIGTGALGFFHIGVLADWLGTQMAVATCALEGLLMLLIVRLIWPEVVGDQALPQQEPSIFVGRNQGSCPGVGEG